MKGANALKLGLEGVENEDAVPPATKRYAAMVIRAREKRGLSQRNLAEAAGINHELMRRIEAGECDPRLGVAIQLAIILGIAEQPDAMRKIAYGQIGANRVTSTGE